MKKLILTILLSIIPLTVNAGTITFSKSTTISDTKYSFDIIVEDATLNYMSGNLSITNGYISNITTSSEWINKTSNNTNFYFYRTTPSSGNYTVATIEVTMTGSSKYSVSNFTYGLLTCTKDNYGNLFGENGSITSSSTYNNTCLLSDDSSLKSLTTSTGTLTPTFNSNTLRYNMQVDESITSLTFYPVLNDDTATIESGTTCTIKEGLNICTIVVKSAKGNTTKYVVGVYKKVDGMPNYDTTITNFQVHNATLTEEFDEDKTSYNLTVNSDADSFYFTFDTNNGTTHHTTDSCSKNASTCKITIKLSDSNQTTKTYTFNVLNNTTTSSTTSSTTSTSKSTSSKTTTSSSTKKTTTNESNSTSSTNETTTDNEALNEEDIEIIIDPTKEDTTTITDEEKTTTNEDISNETEEESNNNIELPFNISISQSTFLTIIGFIIFALGILLGNLITKRKNR